MGLTGHHHLSKHSVDTVSPWHIHFPQSASSTPGLLDHVPYKESKATAGQPGPFLKGPDNLLQESAIVFENQQHWDQVPLI